MEHKVYDLARQIGMDESELKSFEKAVFIEKPAFYKAQNRIVLYIEFEQLLDYQVYDIFVSKLIRQLQCKVDLKMKITNPEYAIVNINKYIRHIVNNNGKLNVFISVFPSLENDTLVYRYQSIEEQQSANELVEELVQELHRFGIILTVDVTQLNMDEKIREAEIQLMEKPAVVQQEKKEMTYQPRKKINDYPIIGIKDLSEGISEVKIQGKIFEIDNRVMRNGKIAQSLYICDDEEAIVIQRFERGKLTKEILEEIKENDYVVASGRVEYNQYRRENIFVPQTIEKIIVPQKQDTAERKRVELHLHTKLSEMDGVSSIEEYIKQANTWGHDAISITDHNVVQAYPTAQRIVSKINMGREKPFKMIYGVEMSMIDNTFDVVYNPDNRELESATYCVFDLETTGLSTKYDHIIEFGATLIENRVVKDTMQMFIKPPIAISSHISELTNITNSDVEQAPTLEEAMPKILAFIGDSVLVAHNASFDVNFLNDSLTRLHMEKINNPVIDTLDLAKALIKDRRGYRLGNVARYYKIKYDADVAHRADYDANILSEVLLHMLNDLKDKKTIADLCSLNKEVSYGSIRDKHVTILAKNEAGIKDIFDLVSMSHTTYLAEVGKSNNKPICAPRIIREEVMKKRALGNILIGSSCLNSEVFEAAHTRGDEHLKKLMEFYDYIEVQPLENYRHMIQLGSIRDEDQLKLILKTMIDMGKELGKVVVASGDAHYVREDHKQIRDVFINAQGIGGVRHPLYIYNREKRLRIPSPKQHFRTTNEMLETFAFLGQQEAYEIVVENTNKIKDMIGFVEPIKSDLYPPHIEGCAKLLSDLCMDTAHSIYGEVLPTIVEERLNKELQSIIGNGFEVVYYVSHLLVKQSLDDGYLVGSRGSVGSSFAATMANITEVNPLAPHYICPHCQYSEFVPEGEVQSGFDLPAKKCPKCGHELVGEGQNIPFETFLGFEGDKVPDIDLNFSGEYQEKAHKFLQEYFGEENAYRAGTIATVASKTAFGYVKGYCEEMDMEGKMSNARTTYVAKECDGVRRSTGQHPGGIIVFPQDMDVSEFTPVQYPSNNPNEDMKTTHLDYHDIEQNVLKFDILGHVDPTAMKILEEMSGVDVRKIPMNDTETMAIFSNVESLNIDTTKNVEKTGAAGIPEFGTPFVRGILEITKPTTFEELLKISGLSHGTDVWLNNAKDLIDNKTCTLKEVIGCRDDIMVYLMQKGMEPKLAFTIMESVRKGRGLRPEWIKEMKANNVEDYYIDSCEKIKYMFPKAHAVAYVTMAVRIAWFKVHKPLHYYCMFFSIRCDAYDIETMVKGEASIKAKMSDIRNRLNNPETKRDVSDKDKNVYSSLELALEMVLRGYRVQNIDINKSQATRYVIDEDHPNSIIPSFVSVDGLGENVALSIVEARKDHSFISKQDLLNRTLLSSTLVKKLEALGVLNGLQDENQMALF
ncbi:DNA polymerase-3 subunit alpha (Gram-positive type) [Breznakia sp. PF5-3]|uniref:PolC-type DNA polymerase III n=1 Tax=unclassified Breznakia TaxID=2623764 RepID=UPI0024069EBC|nr:MULTISPECIES: PolC-type DNA polymerase III [unclassified Breznakia]MDF9824668.1 DNA polymerase-3 subunit alpha (Gram-positive type) [Breznakia sp. PM6-1]MDF9835653.1 DNA polymerase-3 subunit alpha (Gram-positive type) [Breznakia sp. PF5-3]MDF9837682.1 DNA polymerase-3 subunit alpha (Gram-positive type) [Breznakia sp. PFB2-8]MDF9859546.1 DNA polymerase-3 subunit alpha (Gram-positive type) [Breznakia sp. PH5-24]